MILTDDVIKQLIKTPYNGKTIARGRELFTEHIRHVKGIGVEDFFKANDIKGYENEEEKLLRRKISRATTVPIYASALGTFEKAFSASGYSSYYDFGNNGDELRKDFKNYLNSKAGEGMGIHDVMQYVWGDKIHYDFNGVMMVELPKKEPGETAGAKSEPYIIFKSIMDVHDYDVDGYNCEYLILNYCPEVETAETKEYKYYRVIDDERDLICRTKGEDFQILNSDVYPILKNIWGYVPAVVLSSQVDAITEAKQSYIWKSIGTADDFLLDSSIQNISKKKHGFPQRWTYSVPCKMCSGEGRFPIYGEFDTATNTRPILNYRKCADCTNGSITVSPSIAVVKPMPDANNPDIGEPFGYVTPDISSIDFQTKEMERLRKIINDSIWSEIEVEQSETTSSQTATGRILDVSPKITKLSLFSSNGESIEHFLTDALGRARYGEIYKGSVVKWGRKYYILTENEIEQTYKDAKQAGVNSSILRSYLEDLIYVKYSTDPLELERQLKLFECEPFVHMTVQEVQDLKYASDVDKFMKTYFNDYIQELEQTKPMFLMASVTEIKVQISALNEKKMQEAKSNMSFAPVVQQPVI